MCKSHLIRRALRTASLGVCSLLLLAATVSATPSPEASSTLRDDFGVEISSLRLSANGHLIDFRYKVLDPEKAKALVNREDKPVLIDQATGQKLHVPSMPKVGSLRQTAQSLTAGKIYFVLFSNAKKVVKSGQKVTVSIGDFRAENLTVE